MIKKIFLSVFTLLVFLVVSLFFIDLKRYAQPYLHKAEIQLDKNIKVGSINFYVVPTPRLMVNNIEINDKDGTPFFVVDNISLVLNFFESITGNPCLQTAKINSPNIYLKNYKNNNNWTMPENNDEFSKLEGESTKSEKTPLDSFFQYVPLLNIENAHISYTDYSNPKGQEPMKIDNLYIKLVAPTLKKQAVLEIKATAFENSFTFLNQFDVQKNLVSFKGQLNVENAKFKVSCDAATSFEMSTQGIESVLSLNSISSTEVIELPNKKINLNDLQQVSAAVIGDMKNGFFLKDLKIIHPLFSISGNGSIIDKDLSVLMNLSASLTDVDFKIDSQDLDKIKIAIIGKNTQGLQKWFVEEALCKDTINFSGHTKLSNPNIFYIDTVNVGKAKFVGKISMNNGVNEVELQTPEIRYWLMLLDMEQDIVKDKAQINLTVNPDEKIHIITTNKFLSFIANAEKKSDQWVIKLALQKLVLGDNHFSGKVDVSYGPEKISSNVQSLNVKTPFVPNINLNGNVEVNLKGKIPYITGNIHAAKISIAEITPSKVERNYPIQQNINSPSQRWSRDPLELPLDKFDMNFDLNLPALAAAGLVFKNLKSKITLKNGALNMPFSADLFDGKINAGLYLTSKNLLNFEGNISNVNIQKHDILKKYFSSGLLNSNVAFSSYGKSEYEIIKNLKGSAKAEVVNGVMMGFSLPLIVNMIQNPKTIVDGSAIGQAFGQSASSRFEKLQSVFQLNNGQMQTSNTILQMENAQVSITGVADILGWKSDFNAQVKVSPLTDKLPPVIFQIYGPLDDPKYRFDKNFFKSFLEKKTQNVIKKSLSKAIGDIVGDQQDGSGKINPKSILKGIFG